MLITRLRFGFLLATLVTSLHVAAVPRYWTLTGVQFEDGAVATGYVSYDDATGTIVNWNLRVSGGAEPFIAWTIVPGISHAWDSPHPYLYSSPQLYLYSYEPDLVPGFWWRSLVITPLVPLDGRSTTVPINVSRSLEFFENDYDGGNPSFRIGPSRKFVAGSLVLSTSPAPAQAVDINQHGLTGSWYNPATPGQGIQLEAYENALAPGVGYLVGTWATFDEYTTPCWERSRGQRWYTFGGPVLTGQELATFVLRLNLGGNFNAPPMTSGMPVGTVTLRFRDCRSADMEYTWADETHCCPETIPLVRLTPNVTCSATAGGSMRSDDFALSGNWFDPTTAGQGIALELNPNAGAVFFVWYTYASDGEGKGAAGQRWYTGYANYVPGSRTLPVTLYESGFTLPFAIDVCEPAVNWGMQHVAVGTATVTFSSCDEASLAFSFTGGNNAGASGTINLSRVGPTPADCLR